MVGAAPSFSEVHVVRTLFILNNRKIGRKALVEELGLGEGSVRTILKNLRKGGLIASSRLGHELTEEGEKRIREYLLRFSYPQPFELEGIGFLTAEGMYHSLVVVHNASEKIGNGMEQRDKAFSVGARGALVLIHKEKKSRLPTEEVDLSDFPQMADKLIGLELREGDVVVISFGESYAKAEDGAIAVALDLLEVK